MLRVILTVSVVAVAALASGAPAASAQSSLPEEFSEPKIALTFDDGLASTYTRAAPILSSRDIPATVYVITDYVGRDGYMSWTEIRELQDEYGWEIGSQSVSHPELPTLGTDDIRNEIRKSKEILQSKGLHVESFAAPFGAYDSRVLAEAAKYFRSQRGFWDRDDFNIWPYNQTTLTVQCLDSSTTVETVYEWIDRAVDEGKWLILVLHEIDEELDSEYAYTNTVAQLEEIADYIEGADIEPVTVREAMQMAPARLVIAETFREGIAEGWWTDAPDLVVSDKGTHGAYPDPKHSIRFKRPGDSPAHLYGPVTPTDVPAAYLVQGFVEATSLHTGEFGFYIDEYDSGNEWVSGQWLGAFRADTVAHFSGFYQPTSDDVASFRLQVYFEAGSEKEVYLDQVKVYALHSDD